MAVLQDLRQMQLEREQLLARIAELEAKPKRGVSFKVTEKGGVSVYGLGRFPVTLYRGQWERLIATGEELQEFIRANSARLSVKD